MKKFFLLLILAFFMISCLSACTKKQEESMIQSKRKFAKYIEPLENKKYTGMIDLSEGPRLNYNFSFGPITPSFDFKIENPY